MPILSSHLHLCLPPPAAPTPRTLTPACRKLLEGEETRITTGVGYTSMGMGMGMGMGMLV